MSEMRGEVPTRGGHREMLENALDSLLAQSNTHWEAIVVWNRVRRTPAADSVGTAQLRLEPFDIDAHTPLGMLPRRHRLDPRIRFRQTWRLPTGPNWGGRIRSP